MHVQSVCSPTDKIQIRSNSCSSQLMNLCLWLWLFLFVLLINALLEGFYMILALPPVFMFLKAVLLKVDIQYLRFRIKFGTKESAFFMAEGCMNMAESGTNQLPFLWWKCFKQSISFWYCRGIESLTFFPCEVRGGENPGNEAYYLRCLKTLNRVLISTSVLSSGFYRLIKGWPTLHPFETRPWPVGRAHNP